MRRADIADGVEQQVPRLAPGRFRQDGDVDGRNDEEDSEDFA